MEIKVPEIGDYADVPVIEIHVAPGDVVRAEDPLVTLETDKATMDIPAPFRGHHRFGVREGGGLGQRGHRHRDLVRCGRCGR
ncbi:biotin/lipoyl-containing protein [Nocardioides sp. B-3]|uniref:biotin/lipoyl-containing protein n=1 Tax=Nocardioides sp. B-3 TaxID=2895565 RepID=UPI002152801F|nr:biotin/lipoyl-containing protein [Nocardioides sp. B-3]UUZ58469.1 hypothetical protein LP418_20150 [Nocardioides sp. B-3]